MNEKCETTNCPNTAYDSFEGKLLCDVCSYKEKLATKCGGCKRPISNSAPICMIGSEFFHKGDCFENMKLRMNFH